MRRILRHRPSSGTVLGLTALVVAIGGVAFAAIPDSNGTIHGCYSKSNGNLRVVESAADCRSSETALPWNQQGPPGGTTQVFSDEKSAEVSTTSTASFVDLGGPQLTLTFPASGLVHTYARWEAHGVAGVLAACVGLFLDGQPYVDFSAGLDGLIGCTSGNEFQREFISQPIALEASPGPHTVSLRYAVLCTSGCPAGGTAYFRNRKLWVAPVG